MSGSNFAYGLLIGLAIALVYAAYTDIRSRLIENWLNLGIVCVAPLFWWASQQGLHDILWHVGVAVATFAALALLFALGGMGGGDVKLLTAMALWFQPLWFLRLLLVMSLLGGVLTLLMWIFHKARKNSKKPMIPYGVAIAAAGLWALTSQYTALLPPSFRLG